MHHIPRTLLVLLATLALALLVAGCGADGADVPDRGNAPAEDDGEVFGGGTAEQATAQLQLRIDNVGSRDDAGLPVPSTIACDRSLPATCRATIECPVAEDSGDERLRTTCRWLAGEGRSLLLEDPPEREVCTQQYGGPEVATVTGTLDGERVDATFSRENGCAIARYDAVQVLWTGELADQGAGGGGEPLPPDPDAPVSSTDTEPRVIDDPPEAFGYDQ
jgi:hypothetical protein